MILRSLDEGNAFILVKVQTSSRALLPLFHKKAWFSDGEMLDGTADWYFEFANMRQYNLHHAVSSTGIRYLLAGRERP